jgi:hypothetical protein
MASVDIGIYGIAWRSGRVFDMDGYGLSNMYNISSLFRDFCTKKTRI